MIVDSESEGYVYFAWRQTFGSIVSTQEFRLGGLLWAIGGRVDLQDVRDKSSVGTNRYSTGWGDCGWSFFPLVGKESVTKGGAVSDSWYVDPVNMFGLLSAC